MDYATSIKITISNPQEKGKLIPFSEFEDFILTNPTQQARIEMRNGQNLIILEEEHSGTEGISGNALTIIQNDIGKDNSNRRLITSFLKLDVFWLDKQKNNVIKFVSLSKMFNNQIFADNDNYTVRLDKNRTFIINVPHKLEAWNNENFTSFIRNVQPRLETWTNKRFTSTGVIIVSDYMNDPTDYGTTKNSTFVIDIPETNIGQVTNNTGQFSIPILSQYNAVDGYINWKLTSLPSTLTIAGYNKEYGTDYIGFNTVNCDYNVINENNHYLSLKIILGKQQVQLI
ncbi:hypothetical protein U3516DRAFT_743765 [Neocallimastix sp. 'constans']